MTIKEWQELGYNLAEAERLVKLEGYEKLYEEFAHMVFYSKNL